jgi:hypothetical protein
MDCANALKVPRIEESDSRAVVLYSNWAKGALRRCLKVMRWHEPDELMSMCREKLGRWEAVALQLKGRLARRSLAKASSTGAGLIACVWAGAPVYLAHVQACTLPL